LVPEFVPGLELARAFYSEAVRPLVTVPHAAALLGEGSEVLGFDQPRSTDHAWGPRLQIFVTTSAVETVSGAIERGLPDQFNGWPVRFFSWQTNSVRHHVEVSALDDWVRSQIGADAPTGEFSISDWLALPQQKLLQITAGQVFHDDVGNLLRLRKTLAWYPRNVWLWAMACQWHLIGNAEPRVGRAVEAGDKRGATLLAARIVRLIMEMSFLQERRYWPYDKWFGTAFSGLSIAPVLGPHLDEALSPADNDARVAALHTALTIAAERHNRLGLTRQVAVEIRQFQVGINDAVRPYRVINAGAFVEACKAAITDEALRKMVTVGTFDQLTHGDDALVNFTDWSRRIARVYEDLLG